MARVVVSVGLAVGLLASPALAQETVDPCSAIANPFDRVPVQEIKPDCLPSDLVFSVADTLLNEENSLAPNSRVVTFSENKLRDLANGALESGGGVSPSVNITDYGMIGANLKLSVVTPRKQSDLQKQAATDQNVVWIKHETGARARAGFGRSIAIGDTGAFVRVGLNGGAQLRITTERPYRKSSTTNAVIDALRDRLSAGGVVARNPFSAGAWEDCVPGEKVTIEAPRSVRFNYGLGWGVTEELEDWVTAGANASLDRTRLLSGNLVQTVECLQPGQVRVSLREKRQKYKDLSLNAFAGLSFNDGEIVDALNVPDGVGFIAKPAVSAVTNEAEDILSARYTMRFWSTSPAFENKPELEVANGTFRLDSRTSRDAFENAMRGDFDPALRVSRCGSESNPVVFRSQEQSFDRQGVFRSLRIAKHEIRSSSSTGDGVRIFRGPDGVKKQNVSDLDIERSRALGRAGNLHCEVVIQQIQETGNKRVWVQCGGKVSENFTTNGEFADMLVGAQALAAHDPAAQESLGRVFAQPPDGKVGYLPTWLATAAGIAGTIALHGMPAPLLLTAAGPGFNDHWGKTEAHLELVVNEQGIENIMSAGEEGLWKALAMPRIKPPLWGDMATHPEFDYAVEHGCWNEANARNSESGSSNYQCSDVRDEVLAELHEYNRYHEIIERAMHIKDLTDKVEKARLARDILADFQLPHLLFLGDAYDTTGLVAMGVLARKNGRKMSVSLSADDGKLNWEWTEALGD